MTITHQQLLKAYRGYKTLPRVVQAFLLLFSQKYERSLKASYAQIASLLNLHHSQARELMELLEEQGYIERQNTVWRPDRQVYGRNIYSLKERGLKLLHAARSYAKHFQGIPKYLIPLILVYRRKVSRIISPYEATNKCPKRDLEIKYICQGVLKIRTETSFQKKIREEIARKMELLPKKLSMTASALNANGLLRYSEEQITKAVRVLVKKSYARHPWKLFTFLLNQVAAHGRVPSGINIVPEEVYAIMSTDAEVLEDRISLKTVVDGLRSIGNVTLKDVKSLVRRVKGSLRRLAFSLELLDFAQRNEDLYPIKTKIGYLNWIIDRKFQSKQEFFQKTTV